MTANFKAVCWLLDHDFQSVCTEGHQFYAYTHAHKSIYVRQLDPVEPKDDYRDNYCCYINKHATQDGIIANSAISFSSKDWVQATGLTPKRAIRNAITKSLSDPDMKGKDELRSYDLTLNPVFWFIKDCIAYITKH